MPTVFEKPTTLENNKTAIFDFKDSRITDAFEKHFYLIGGDQVFNKIFQTINEGWGKLNPKQQQEALDSVEDLIRTLKDYNAAYTTHKSASRRKRVEDYQSIQDYQSGVKRADAIEATLHNKFVDTINILSRKMRAMGLDNSWRKNDEIYGLTPDAARNKPKLWMFKIFREKI